MFRWEWHWRRILVVRVLLDEVLLGLVNGGWTLLSQCITLLLLGQLGGARGCQLAGLLLELFCITLFVPLECEPLVFIARSLNYIFMGFVFSKLFGRLVGKKEIKILILGLDNSGKTTILSRKGTAT